MKSTFVQPANFWPLLDDLQVVLFLCWREKPTHKQRKLNYSSFGGPLKPRMLHDFLSQEFFKLQVRAAVDPSGKKVKIIIN